jgi:hypothetical protein
LEVVSVHVDYEVLMKVEENILLIVACPQEILDYQLRPCPINLLNFIIIILNFIEP